MDVFSHGLWGSVAFGRKNRRSFWLAFLFGVAPDLVAFTPFSVWHLIDSGFHFLSGPPEISSIPEYVFRVYDVSHSLVISIAAFALVWFFMRRPVYEMLAWPLHILIDIPTHSANFFPTPFLWPFSDFYVDGHPWGDPLIFIPNVVILLSLYVWYFVVRPRLRRKSAEETDSNGEVPAYKDVV